MCSFHGKIWFICGRLHQVKTASYQICLKFNLLEAVQWNCNVSVSPTKESNLPGYDLMVPHLGKFCIHNKGASNALKQSPFWSGICQVGNWAYQLIWQLRRTRSIPTTRAFIQCEIHRVGTVLIFLYMYYPDLHFCFSVDYPELLLRKRWCFDFWLFQKFFMSFLINLSSRLAHLINLPRKDNKVSFALARQY